MLNKQIITEVREKFRLKQGSFTKDEMKYNANKDTFKGKITGFLTLEYYQREKLFNTGNIFYALSYKEYHEHAEKDKKMFPVWVLFSPSTKIDENPHLLEKVKDNLDQLLLDKELAKKYHHLLMMYSDNLAEPKYYKVPDEFSPDFDCYICLTNLIQSRFPVFHLGINLVIANKKVSNEFHYLPYVYWTEEFLKQY